MSLVDAVRFGLGGVCMILLLLVTVHYQQSITLKKLADDLKEAATQLDDISDQVAKIAAKIDNYYG